MDGHTSPHTISVVALAKRDYRMSLSGDKKFSMKTPLVLLSLVVFFVGLPSVVFASPTIGPHNTETGWTSWEGWPVLVFLLGLGLMIFLIYIALRFSKKR